MDKAEDAKVREIVREELERLGIYSSDPEHLEITRANFVWLNSQRKKSNAKVNAERKGFRDFLVSFGSQILVWIIAALAGAVVAYFKLGPH